MSVLISWTIPSWLTHSWLQHVYTSHKSPENHWAHQQGWQELRCEIVCGRPPTAREMALCSPAPPRGRPEGLVKSPAPWAIPQRRCQVGAGWDCVLLSQSGCNKIPQCALNNRNLPTHSCGGRKSKINVSAGLVPSEAVRKSPFQGSLLLAGGWLAIFGFCCIHAFIFTRYSPWVRPNLPFMTPVILH